MGELAKTSECTVHYSHDFFPQTQSYIATVRPQEGSNVQGDPVTFISRFTGLLHKSTKVEIEILVPEGIAHEMIENNITHLLQERANCELVWSANENKFANPPIQFH